MAEVTDITVSILREIRDGIHATNQRLESLEGKVDSTNQRLDSTNQRLDSTNQRLESLEGKVDVMNDNIEAIGRYTKNISRRHEKAIDELRERVAKLEARRKN